MSTRDLIMMAVRNLWKRKLRTFLTILGVVIGTTSIVVMISIGIGMNESFEKQVEEWGSLQVIDVYSNNGDMYISSDTNANRGKPQKKAVLDAAAIDKFKQMEYVEAVSPIVRESMMLVCGKYVSNASFIGIDPSAMEALGYKVEEGRTLTAEDKEGIVIGRGVITSFYNPKLSWQMQMQTEPPEINVMEEKVIMTYDWNYGTKHADKSIKPIKTPVLGIMPDGGGNGYSVVMPLKQMEKIQKDKEAFSCIEEIVSMGGSFKSHGNCSPVAEYNYWCDPDGASLVYETLHQNGQKIHMVGLDVTQKVRLTTDHVAILDKYAAPENRPIVDYLKQALPFYFRFNRLQNNCLDHCPVHDPLAMLAAVDPSVVTVRTIPARVECGGSFCRGMVVADLREHPIEAPGVSICVDVDSRRALEELLTTFMA